MLTETKRPISMEDNTEYQLVTVKRRNEGVISRGFFKGKDVLVKNYYKLQTGDYLISKRQIVHGANGLVPANLDGAIVSNEYLVSVGNQNISTDFLAIISKLPAMYRSFFLSSYGIDIEKLVFDVEDWKKRSIITPSLAEQNMISSFFRTLDDTITLYQRKLEGLRALKKGYLEQMFPKAGEHLPQIRFAGFEGEWEERKFIEVYTHFQNNTLSRAELNYKSGISMNIHYGDVLIKFGECLDIQNTKLPFVSRESVVAKYSASFIRDGDVIIADTAEDETAGKCCEVINLYGAKVLSGLHTIPCRPNWEFATGYLGYYMNSPSYRSHLRPLMQGVKVTSVSKSSLKYTNIVYPKAIAEQAAIGNFFRKLDEQFTTCQHKLSMLKQLKAAYIQKMFV